MFNERNFRHIPENLSREIFGAPTNPLIVLTPDGASTYFQSADMKRNIFPFINRKTHIVLRVWPGKTRTDVFEIRPEDLPILFPGQNLNATIGNGQDSNGDMTEDTSRTTQSGDTQEQSS